MFRYIILLFFIILTFNACVSSKLYLAEPDDNKTHIALPSKGLDHKIYMIGDAGGIDDKMAYKNDVISAVSKSLENDNTECSVVLLGDNIYNYGLGTKEDKNRQLQENILKAQLRLADYGNTNLYFIPGNHDWNDNKKEGLNAIKRQAQFINKNSISKDRVKFYPEKGCGDPQVVRVNSDLVYIFIDTQWWVHNWSGEKDINRGCKVKSRREFLDNMKDIIIEHKNDKILIFLHHPMVSNGRHGGNFSLKDHLFPLPIIGSAYTVFRQLGGSNQDNSYHLLRALHESLEGVIRNYEASRTIFISGHDHILQHSVEQFIFQRAPIHYIVSGAGYKSDYVSRDNGASYAQSAKGYGVLSTYKDGSTWLDFYSLKETGESKLEYRSEIYTSNPGKIEFKKEKYFPSNDSFIVAAPNPGFAKRRVYKYLMGEQFRPAWTTPIKTQEFNLARFHGGLSPIKKGGGLFSRTLRLKNSKGYQYVLRSVNKDFFKAVPNNLKHLRIMKLYSDQITASIPYGALYISELSKAAKVYHTTPQVVYLNEPKELGPFQPFFPKGHYLLEERPSGDWSDTELFGNSENIISYNDLLQILRKEANSYVDQKWVLKSRLFDMLIHDRDRHDDQWRWAAFEEEGKTIYRPIPRDRDWAFFKYVGVIPSILGNIVDKKLKSFSGKSIDVKSLATNANWFDRYFLNELTWEEWEEEIDKFVDSISDEDIEHAIQVLPEESRVYLTKEIVPKLKSRKRILKKEVKKYYDFITKEIEITGTDDQDIFNIEQQSNGDISITVYRRSKKNGNVTTYKRKIKSQETDEIRLYGLAAEDQFNIDVKGDSKIKIRIIGGIGDDDVQVINSNSFKAKFIVYDDPNGMEISNPELVEAKLDNDLLTNEYKRRGFLYDTGLPWITLAFAPDNGLTFGFGYSSIKHGWRKLPYKSKHFFTIQITPKTKLSYDMKYKGDFIGLFGKGLDFVPIVFSELPDNINYFGLGKAMNENVLDSRYNRIQLSRQGIHAMLVHRAAQRRVSLGIGPIYESYKLEVKDDIEHITNVLPEFTSKSFDRNHFFGIQSDIRIRTLNSVMKPTRGLQFENQIRYQYELGSKNSSLKFSGNLSWFTPISTKHDITFGSNTGFQHIIGTPRFYQYPAMGNNEFLRPFRNERHRGESVVYQQFDIRYRIISWNNSIIPVTIGGVNGYDFGQSYFNNEVTGGIKHGWTAGLWFDFVGAIIFRTEYSKSEEGAYVRFEAGYAF